MHFGGDLAPQLFSKNMTGCQGHVMNLIESDFKEARIPSSNLGFLGGGFNYFLFSPRKLGKMSNLTHIFQRGWFSSTTN